MRVNRHISNPFRPPIETTVFELDKSRRAVLKRMQIVLAHIGGDIATMFGIDFVKRLREMMPHKESSHGAKRLAHREMQLAMRGHFQTFGDYAFGGACDLHPDVTGQ